MLAGLAAIALLIGVATGSGPGKAATRATPSRPNIVIVGIDSLRSDLSLPRGGDAAMPGFREFLRGAHRFTDATTPLAPKPIARSVAMSRARALTAEYIVFSALKTAPTAMMPPTT